MILSFFSRKWKNKTLVSWGSSTQFYYKSNEKVYSERIIFFLFYIFPFQSDFHLIFQISFLPFPSFVSKRVRVFWIISSYERMCWVSPLVLISSQRFMYEKPFILQKKDWKIFLNFKFSLDEDERCKVKCNLIRKFN